MYKKYRIKINILMRFVKRIRKLLVNRCWIRLRNIQVNIMELVYRIIWRIINKMIVLDLGHRISRIKHQMIKVN